MNLMDVAVRKEYQLHVLKGTNGQEPSLESQFCEEDQPLGMNDVNKQRQNIIHELSHMFDEEDEEAAAFHERKKVAGKQLDEFRFLTGLKANPTQESGSCDGNLDQD
jgi:hypothetical protein